MIDYDLLVVRDCVRDNQEKLKALNTKVDILIKLVKKLLNDE